LQRIVDGVVERVNSKWWNEINGSVAENDLDKFRVPRQEPPSLPPPPKPSRQQETHIDRRYNGRFGRVLDPVVQIQRSQPDILDVGVQWVAGVDLVVCDTFDQRIALANGDVGGSRTTTLRMRASATDA
jgi:hypothetical protein